VTIQQWARNIYKGAYTDGSQVPTEESQGISFVVTDITSAALFKVLPHITAAGSLMFEVSPNSFGLSFVTLYAVDDGGTAYGGEDRTAPVTFDITLLPNKDVQAFIAAEKITVMEGSDNILYSFVQTVVPGPAFEYLMTYNGTVVVFESVYFGSLPEFGTNGTLFFQPAPSVFGTTVVQVYFICLDMPFSTCTSIVLPFF
jgi:hypothetical protein